MVDSQAEQVRLPYFKRTGRRKDSAENKKGKSLMPKPLIDEAVKAKVADLLSGMSLQQKIGQMTQADRLTCTPQDVQRYNLGSVLSAAGSCPEENTLGSWVTMNDQYWQASMGNSSGRRQIPILYGLDAIHGNNNVANATVFPHNIGLGATRDLFLLERVTDATRREVLASGVDWVFAPNLAVARDYHWGRCYESFSEDPKLVSEYAKVIVKRLQANRGDDSVLACVKHWVGDGGTTNGIDQGDTHLDWDTLNSLHIAPYFSALEAGALTVMASFSSWNGVKCHAHKHLITHVLKEQMGFEGFVISDMQGIDYLAEDFYHAVEKGVNAGIDMFMVPDNWKLFMEYLQVHVEMGTVSMTRINNAVARILSVKVAMGLFDKPRPADRKFTLSAEFASVDHRDIAREAVRKSLVLLKNDKDILPLSTSQRILVAGKNADNIGHQCGGFTLSWQGVSGNEPFQNGSSIWQGIKAASTNVTLSKSEFGEDADPSKHDVAVVVIGEKPYAEGLGDIRAKDASISEAGSCIEGQVNLMNAMGDSLELKHLHPEDLTTLQNIQNKGIPIVAVLISGRPLVIQSELGLVDAFVAAWLPGTEGGGVADLLFGDFDFQGKLSFSWPKVTHPTVNLDDKDYHPLFPFGYGLTYSESVAVSS